MRRCLAAALVAFMGIAAGAIVLILVWAPTTSPARLVALLGTMFAFTGAVVVAATVWAAGRR